MKRLLFALALVAAISVACDDDKPQQELEPELKFDLMPQKASEEVTSFFKEHLPDYYDRSDCFFIGEDGYPERSDICLVIDSADEFKAAVSSDIELPEIDFDKYTLVVGQFWVGDSGYRIINHGIDIDSIRYLFYLVVEELPGFTHPTVETLYYWGLYPKLSSSNTVVFNVIYKDKWI